LDFNANRMHKVVLKNTDPQSVVTRITPIASKRDVVIVYSSCKDDRCEFSMKRKPQTIGSVSGGGRLHRGTGSLSIDTSNVSFSSRFYGRTSRSGSDTILEMLGAPAMNEIVSCPPQLEQLRRCKPATVTVRNASSVAEAASSQFGADVSGRIEAEILSGICTELQLQ
jgi:hypothetical protein